MCGGGGGAHTESINCFGTNKAFQATGASGWGRVDLMQDNQGNWQLLEVNTVPGMTKTSLVPKAAKEHGLNFSELVERIVQLSL